MAFIDQVQDLVGQTVSDTGAVTNFLTSTAREITDILPDDVLIKNATLDTSDTSNPYDASNARILSVARDGRYATEVPYGMSSYVADSGSIYASSVRDPVYYYQGSSMYVIPAPSVSKPFQVMKIAYPSPSYNSTDIANFPDSAEYAVILGATSRTLMHLMANGYFTTSTAITTALTYFKAALDQAETAGDKFEQADTESIFGDEETFLTANSTLTKVKAALDRAKAYVDGDEPSATTDAYGALANEDVEIVQAALGIASTEMQRAQAHLQEWTSIGDMRVKEINSALSEAQGYAQEAQTRMQEEQSRYTWMGEQYQRLQAEYQRELQRLRGQK